MYFKKMLKILFLCYLFLLACLAQSTEETVRRPKIAIIGAGIGGASCSYFLQELFEKEVEIDIYERYKVGGRLATVEIDGRHYEAGGAIIHPANLYMKNLSRLLGLREKDHDHFRFAIFNGEELVFDGSKYEILMVLQLFYQYGFDLVRINRYVKNMLINFEKIYDHQHHGHAFTTVEKLLSSMDPEYVKGLEVSLEDSLKDYGLHEEFISQVAHGGLQSNYGQDERVHSFVGAVSMAGIEPGLWSVEDGNKRVPEELVNKSGSNLIYSNVKKITLLEEEEYKVTSVNSDGSFSEKVYDYVVIAAPLYSNDTEIYFEGFPPIAFPKVYNMHKLYATFIQGIPNAETFGVANVYTFPQELLVCKNDNNVYFNSMGKQTPVDWTTEEGESDKSSKKNLQKSVYKVFSNKALTDEQIQEMFLLQEQVKVVEWLAYPDYPLIKDDLPSFVLHPKLYHVNAIEMAASAMEMSAIGGRNVALLIANHFEDVDSDFTDNVEITGLVDHLRKRKTEL